MRPLLFIQFSQPTTHLQNRSRFLLRPHGRVWYTRKLKLHPRHRCGEGRPRADVWVPHPQPQAGAGRGRGAQIFQSELCWGLSVNSELGGVWQLAPVDGPDNADPCCTSLRKLCQKQGSSVAVKHILHKELGVKNP